MKCARHPEVETNLACGKCGQPICPKCLVQTPVGARCPDCAALKRLPTFQIPTAYFARAIGAGSLTALALGAIWPFIPWGGFLLFLLAMGIGYAIGEVVSLATNRKRGPGLQAIAGGCMLLSYIVRSLLETPYLSFSSRFLDVYGLIALVLGIVVAVGRLR